MNTHENRTAAELLVQIEICARQEPEKAKTLAEAYKALCEAAATREKADQ